MCGIIRLHIGSISQGLAGGLVQRQLPTGQLAVHQLGVVGKLGAIILQALLCWRPGDHVLADCNQQRPGLPDGQDDGDDSGTQQQDETNNHPKPARTAKIKVGASTS